VSEKRTPRSARWLHDAQTPEDLPRGPAERLEDALSLLAPFASGATTGQPETPSSGRSKQPRLLTLSRDQATRLITLFATQYNWHVRLEQDAPRIKAVLDQLHRVEEQADALRRTLTGLDDFARAALQQRHDVLKPVPGDRGDALGLLYRDAGGERLPMPEPDPRMPGPAWTGELADLSRYAGLIAGLLADTWGTGDPDRVDRGGRANTYRKLQGNPKWRLVCSAWALFETNPPWRGHRHRGRPILSARRGDLRVRHGGPSGGDHRIGLVRQARCCGRSRGSTDHGGGFGEGSQETGRPTTTGRCGSRIRQRHQSPKAGSISEGKRSRGSLPRSTIHPAPASYERVRVDDPRAGAAAGFVLYAALLTPLS
jgi:hypothetical protein